MMTLIGSPKRVAAIHDLSGFGRCSLTAVMPILSVMGLQCCPLPTAVLSNHTGYPDFTYLDFTPHLPDFIARWQSLGLSFDTLYSGFLGSVEQVDLVADFFRRFRSAGTLVAVDPVMGDNGRKYATFPDSMCDRMRTLVTFADIVFPNLTEAFLLTGADPASPSPGREGIAKMAAAISALGPKQVVITGVDAGRKVTNYAWDFKASRAFEVTTSYSGHSYNGTGDMFAAIVCGSLTLGRGLEESVTLAARFIERAATRSSELGTDPREGILFEPYLKELIP